MFFLLIREPPSTSAKAWIARSHLAKKQTRKRVKKYSLFANGEWHAQNALKTTLISLSFQWDIICHTCGVTCPIPCPRQGQTNSEDLDITCIVILIRNLDKILLGKHWQYKIGRNILPHVTDALQIRNDLIHCTLQDIVTRPQFTTFLKRIGLNSEQTWI